MPGSLAGAGRSNLRLMSGRRRILEFAGSSPTRKQFEAVLRPRAGLGGVDEQRQSRIGRQFHALIPQFELANHRMMQVLHAGAVQAHVVRGPPGAEILAAGGQFADELDKLWSWPLRPASERSMAAMSSAAS